MFELDDNSLSELLAASERITEILQDAKERALYSAWKQLPVSNPFEKRASLHDTIESLRCPYCDSKMGLRNNKTTNQNFAGCQNFFTTGCRGVISLTD